MTSGHPAIVSGLVPGSVTSVDFVGAGTSHPAALASGAYFYDLAPTEPWPQGVVLKYRDGSSAAIGIPSISPVQHPDAG